VRWLAATADIRVEPSGCRHHRRIAAAGKVHSLGAHRGGPCNGRQRGSRAVRRVPPPECPNSPVCWLATEDSALARKRSSWVLKENGYDVVTALGTAQMLERLEQEEYEPPRHRTLATPDCGPGLDALDLRACRGRWPVTRTSRSFVLTDPGFDPARPRDPVRPGNPPTLCSGRIAWRASCWRESKAHPARSGASSIRARAEAAGRGTNLVAILKEVHGIAQFRKKSHQILVPARRRPALRIARCSVVAWRQPGDLGGDGGRRIREFRTLLRSGASICPDIRRLSARPFETNQNGDGDGRGTADPLYQDVRGHVGQRNQARSAPRSVDRDWPFMVGNSALRASSSCAPPPTIRRSTASTWALRSKVIEAAVTAPRTRAYDLGKRAAGRANRSCGEIGRY